MNKQTKRIRRNRKNKTRKYYGGAVDVDDKSKGILDIISDKITGYSGKAINYVKDKGLRLVGLQPIQQSEVEQNPATQEVDQKVNEIGNAASEIIGNVKDVVDKGSAAILGNINDVLESPRVNESLTEAAGETAQIGEKLLETFNEKLSTPEMKEEAKIALDNAADFAEIAVDALDKPLNKAVDELNQAGTRAASGIASGLVKVGTDALSAVPGAGAVIEVGKIVNDASRALGDVVGAASQASSTVSKVVEETSKNITEGIEKLEEKKERIADAVAANTNLSPDVNLNPDVSLNPDVNLNPDDTLKELNKVGGSISNRVEKSIDEFENPVSTVPVVQQGGKKTRRKLFKHKGKSKRVRFSI